MSTDPRSRNRPCRATEFRLANDIDVWVARASVDGVPYLVRLCFDPHGEALIMATPTETR